MRGHFSYFYHGMLYAQCICCWTAWPFIGIPQRLLAALSYSRYHSCSININEQAYMSVAFAWATGVPQHGVPAVGDLITWRTGVMDYHS